MLSVKIRHDIIDYNVVQFLLVCHGINQILHSVFYLFLFFDN